MTQYLTELTNELIATFNFDAVYDDGRLNNGDDFAHFVAHKIWLDFMQVGKKKVKPATCGRILGEFKLATFSAKKPQVDAFLARTGTDMSEHLYMATCISLAFLIVDRLYQGNDPWPGVELYKRKPLRDDRSQLETVA